MPVAAFGAAARRYASRFPADFDIVFADETMAGDALAECVDRARDGHRFCASLVIDDIRSVAAQRIAATLLTAADKGLRRTYFQGLASYQLSIEGKPWLEYAASICIDANKAQALRGVLFSCDALLVRSWTELEQVRSQLQSISPAPGVRLPVNSVRVVVPPAVRAPSFRPRAGAQAIVVWAPERPAAETALFAFAYEELHMPVIIVCDQPSQAQAFGVRAKFIAPAEVGGYLKEAAVLVDASISDPAAAVELAACGIPLVASGGTGVYEFVDGVLTYDGWNFHSVLHATLTAFGANPPSVRGEAWGTEAIPSALEAARPIPPERTPLVSIVLPTKDRRAILPRALKSIAKQTYPNIEVVIVNDAGPPIDDLVSGLKNVRLIEHETSQGVTRSINGGIAAASGEYIGFLADDDYIFADHVMRVVGALERTGASVGHAMMTAAYLIPDDEGYYTLTGYNLLSVHVADPSDVLVTNVIGGASVMYRRRIFDELGFFDETPKHGSDYELHLRIVQRYDYIMVPRIDANVDFRRDTSNLSVSDQRDNTPILNYLYGKYPVPGRADLEVRRKEIMQFYSTPRSDPSLHNPAVPLSVPRPRHYRLRDPSEVAAKIRPTAGR